MGRNLLKGSIIANIAMLAVTVAVLVAVSFAWFTASQDSEAKQQIQIGSFVVKLNDTASSGFTGASSIDMENAFPMTREFALARAAGAGADNLYRFEVRNGGTISADYRFLVSLTPTYTRPAGESEDHKVNIAPQLRFAVRHSADGANWSDWTPAGEETSDLAALLSGVTTAPDGGQKAEGVLETNGYRVFEVCVWLHEDTTLQQAPAGNGVTLTLTMQAKQHVGGAGWDIFEGAA